MPAPPHPRIYQVPLPPPADCIQYVHQGLGLTRVREIIFPHVEMCTYLSDNITLLIKSWKAGFLLALRIKKKYSFPFGRAT